MRMLHLEYVHVARNAGIADPGVTVIVMTRLLVVPVHMGGRENR